MGEDIIQVKIGTYSVGVIGLTRVLAEVRALDITDEEEIKSEILARVRESNYIADEAEDDYARALFREYRRFLGEKVEEEHGAMEIRILGPGCHRCEELMRRVMTVVAEMNLPADVQHVRDVKKISDYGVIFTPGLVIDGEVKVSGKVPSIKEIKNLLEQR